MAVTCKNCGNYCKVCIKCELEPLQERAKKLEMYVQHFDNCKLIISQGKDECDCGLHDIVKPVKAKEEIDPRTNDEEIQDGFGSKWSKICPHCKKPEMYVVGPGMVACKHCEDKRAQKGQM